MSQRLSVSDIKSIRRHRYILEKLSSLKTSKLRKILKVAPNDLFKVFDLILRHTNQWKLAKHRDIKAFVLLKPKSFRDFLITVLPLIKKL